MKKVLISSASSSYFPVKLLSCFQCVKFCNMNDLEKIFVVVLKTHKRFMNVI